MKPRLRPSGYLVALVLGAFLGSFWDQFDVRSGTLIYAHPNVLGQPWWVPLQFGIAGVLLVWLISTLGDPIPKRASGVVALVEGVWFTALYACTAFFDRKPWIVFVVLLAAMFVRNKDIGLVIAGNLIPAITLIVIGSLAESMLIESNTFAYRTQQLGPLPAWLPLLYANGFLFTLRLTEALLQRFGVRRLVEPATSVVETTTRPQEE